MGILTSNYWYWTSFTPASPILTKSNTILINFDQNKRFENIQVKQSMSHKLTYELQNNLIMGTAINLGLDILYRFTRSARSSCNTCTIVLLMNIQTVNTTDIQLLASVFNVTLIKHETFVPRHKEKAFHHTYIHTNRWFIYYDYLQDLEKIGKAFDNVFFCDVGDTIFQTNVFSHMNSRGDGLYAFMEDINTTIANQTSNAHWIKACYGEQMLQTMGNKPIICSGTVLGSWSAIIPYLATMISQFKSRPDDCIFYLGNDQGIHMFIVHHSLVPNTTIYLISHETGFVGTVGLPMWLKRNKFGLILNANMEIYAVVHQLNRSPQLLSQYGQEYHILPDDVLDKKF